MKKFMISSVAVFAAFAFAGSVSAVSATEIFTPATGYLKYGSGMGAKVSQMANVMAAQKALNVCTNSALVVDGKFGNNTTTVFKTFQASKGIAQDGIIGQVTADKLAACSGDTTTPSTGSTTLSGGAGDATITKTSTDVENPVKEGESDVKVLGFQVEADGSDINVSNVKVILSNNNHANSSEKLTDYVDTVSVWMGSTEVGSIDASDFSRESGAPDTFTKTIALKNAVVKEDKKVKFYVAFTAVDNIDSTDLDAKWDIELNTVRYNDATGAILSQGTGDYSTNPSVIDVMFEDANTDDDLALKSSSSNPDDATVTVDEDDETDDVLALVAKLDNDEDSSEMSIYDIPVILTITNGGTDAVTVEDVVEKVVLEIDGDEYEGDLSGAGTLSAGAGTAAYNFDIDGDTVIDSGDVVDVKVYLTFKSQKDNYQNSLTTVQASIAKATIEAENEEGDEVSGSDINGTNQTGALLTLDTAGASVTITEKTAQGNSTDSDDAYEEGLFSFTVKIEADGNNDLTFDFDNMTYDLLGGTGTVALSVDLEDDNDATDNGSNSYTIAEGETAIFYVDFTVDAASTASYRVRINNIAGQDVNSNNVAGPLTISAS